LLRTMTSITEHKIKNIRLRKITDAKHSGGVRTIDIEGGEGDIELTLFGKKQNLVVDGVDNDDNVSLMDAMQKLLGAETEELKELHGQLQDEKFADSSAVKNREDFAAWCGQKFVRMLLGDLHGFTSGDRLALRRGSTEE